MGSVFCSPDPSVFDMLLVNPGMEKFPQSAKRGGPVMKTCSVLTDQRIAACAPGSFLERLDRSVCSRTEMPGASQCVADGFSESWISLTASPVAPMRKGFDATRVGMDMTNSPISGVFHVGLW